MGEYRIDLVVEGRNDRLAVECDSDRYHTPDKWWEDRIRQRQLERAGWKFWRVWGSAFYKDPDSAMESIIPVLEELDIHPIHFQSSSQKKPQNFYEEEVREEADHKSQDQREEKEIKEKNERLRMNADYLEMINRELHVAREQLSTLNRDLEQKVEERTVEVKKLLEQKEEFIHQLGHEHAVSRPQAYCSLFQLPES